MRIGEPRIVFLDKAVLSVPVDQDELWYSVEPQFQHLLSRSCDAPLLALLVPAMAKGEDVTVEGPISPRLLYNLPTYQALLRMVIPRLQRIEVHAESEPQPRAEGVACGFSGGIDSFHVLAKHHYNPTVSGFQITHLVFANAGSNGRGPASLRLFQKRSSRLLPLADKLDLPLVRVNSNLSSFYGKHLDFQQTLVPRSLSVAHLLSSGIGRYIQGSSYHYANAFVGEARSMEFSEPIAVPLLSTDALDIISYGHHVTRVEKTILVSQIPDSYDTLDVCTRAHDGPTINCSVCDKCLRTQLTLYLIGALHRYSVFDTHAYSERSDQYLRQISTSDDPFAKEIRWYISGANHDLEL